MYILPTKRKAVFKIVFKSRVYEVQRNSITWLSLFFYFLFNLFSEGVMDWFLFLRSHGKTGKAKQRRWGRAGRGGVV